MPAGKSGQGIVFALVMAHHIFYSSILVACGAIGGGIGLRSPGGRRRQGLKKQR
jgi:hypothetical protein